MELKMKITKEDQSQKVKWLHALSIKHFFYYFPQSAQFSSTIARQKRRNQEVLSVVHDFLMLNSLRYRGWHFGILNYSVPIRVRYVDGREKQNKTAILWLSLELTTGGKKWE